MNPNEQQKLLRLGKSPIPQESDRHIPITHASDSLLAELAAMPGRIPSRTLRHLIPIVRKECEGMLDGEVFSVEVSNYHLHIGCAHTRGLYRPATTLPEIRGIAVRLTISFDGRVFRHAYQLQDRLIGTLARVMNIGGGR
jgi:hypothetical protein